VKKLEDVLGVACLTQEDDLRNTVSVLPKGMEVKRLTDNRVLKVSTQRLRPPQRVLDIG